MSFYGVVRTLLRVLLPLRVRTDVYGLEHVPARGPFLLVPNHQSILDPAFVQVACPRPVHTMTKSTEFRGLRRRLLVAMNAFPARRYRIDPQAVRTSLRLLERGRGVCVYPEGERSWDGRLQPFRRGTVRLMLKAGVAVVPCGITGTYELLPRWSRRLARGRVVVRFGEPIRFGAHHGRPARERALPEATRTVRVALRALLDPPGGDAASPGTAMSTPDAEGNGSTGGAGDAAVTHPPTPAKGADAP